MNILKKQSISSTFLKRKVTYDLVLPPNYSPKKKYNLLLMNDGQDYEKLGMSTILKAFWEQGGTPFIFAGLHCNKQRLEEYGTRDILDFKGRGNKANAYQNFVVDEFIPFLKTEVSIEKQNHIFCGFSLGGLSAIDTVWANPTLFSRVGVFSGALWWRSRDYGKEYNEETDRIIHQKVKEGSYAAYLKFWFQCGTNDEKADRNNNGIIDAIDDTLDLIKALEKKGYVSGQTIHYEEIEGGEHNLATWGAVFPSFLAWVFA